MARCSCKQCDHCGDLVHGTVVMDTAEECYRLLLCRVCYEQKVKEVNNGAG